MRLVLHAGTNKTGTTAIQSALTRNRRWLHERGIRYPQLGGGNRFGRNLIFGDREAKAFLGTLDGTTIISSELIYRAIDGHDGYEYTDTYWTNREIYLDRLMSVLSGFDVRVILFFRDPDAYTEALYSTLVIGGRCSLPFEVFAKCIAPLLDYERQQDAFRKRFSDVVVVPYDSVKDRLIPTFCDVAGIPTLPPHNKKVNVTPDARLIYWMAQQMGRDHPMHREFVRSWIASRLFKDRASFSANHPIPAHSAPIDRITRAFNHWRLLRALLS